MPRARKPAPTSTAPTALVNVSASLEAQLVERLDAHAATERRSRSNTIALLLERALAAEKTRAVG